MHPVLMDDVLQNKNSKSNSLSQKIIAIDITLKKGTILSRHDDIAEKLHECPFLNARSV
jgi:hypothetical protein